MGHNLWIRNGRAAMFYVGDEPWHGLGTPLSQPATAAEAITAAGLDWSVVRAPLYVMGHHRLHAVPDKYAVVREDVQGGEDPPILGFVGPQYTPLQNVDAFSFFDPIVGDSAAVYHTAGALGNGERIWILARVPGDFRIAGSDTVEKYLLLSNSHDGQSSIQIKFTPIRVVCQNTLTQALALGATVRVAHLGDIRHRLEEARRLLGFIGSTFTSLEHQFNRMADVAMDQERLTRYLRQVFPGPKDPDDYPALKRAEESRAWASYFFEQGRGNQADGVQGTLWAAYNGVAEFVDHCDRRRMPVDGPDPRRLQYAWFGGGAAVKARAYEAAEALLPA